LAGSLTFFYCLRNVILYINVDSFEYFENRGVNGCLLELITDGYMSITLRTAQHCSRKPWVPPSVHKICLHKTPLFAVGFAAV